MHVTVGKTRISLVRGDITTQSVDAMVNAANSSLLGGGGVDGAIHKVGGPAILEACKAHVAAHGPCEAGDAVVTLAGDLPAKLLIHAVGPKYDDGQRGENVKLERVYRRCLELAVDNGARTIAFPAISTGAYRFPLEPAALIALVIMGRFIKQNEDALDEVRVVLFSDDAFETYERCLGEVARTQLG